MKRAVLILFFLIIITTFWLGHSEASLKLFVGEDEVELEHPLIMINGNIMIPLWVLEKHLGAEVKTFTPSNEIQVVFPDQTILMQLEQESAQVDGQTWKLDVAPQIAEGGIMVPLRFIADRRQMSLVFVQDLMGLRLEKPQPLIPGALKEAEDRTIKDEQEHTEAEGIVIHQPEETQDLREIIFMGGPRSRVFLDLKSYTGYQTNLLTNPDRLVIDLFGVDGEPLPTIEVDDSILVRIRNSRFDDQTMRIVCDLNKSTGYQISSWPDGGLEVEFNYQLTSLGLEEQDDFTHIWFQSSDVPQIDTVFLDNPPRLVLDLQDTSLIAQSFDQAVEHERISRLRVSQHLPSVTRVVLELKQPVAPLPVQAGKKGRFSLPLYNGTAQEAQAYLTELLAIQPESFSAQIVDEQTVDGTLSGLTIVVDPGHGGSDPGAIGYNGTFEKDVNLAVGLYLGEYLTKAGAKVVYTRDTDVYVSIFERPEVAVKSRAHLFVSIHANSHLERGIARGTETLYRARDPISQLLARSVQDEVVKAITLIDRRIWARDDLAVFNGSQIPAILVEIGFLDHPDEEVLLRAPGFQKVAAQGIFKGIERFYLENKK